MIGLIAGCLAFEEELHRAEHVAVIGNRHRGHAIFLGFGNEIVKTDGTVEERVLGVEMKMDELRLGHGFHSRMGAAGPLPFLI